MAKPRHRQPGGAVSGPSSGEGRKAVGGGHREVEMVSQWFEPIEGDRELRIDDKGRLQSGSTRMASGMGAATWRSASTTRARTRAAR